jgi:methionyl-tRNA synthetase
VEPSHRAEIYTVSLETLRICGILLQPFIPTKSAQLLDHLGVTAEERTWEFAEIAKGRIGKLNRAKIFMDPTRLKRSRKET